MIALTAAMQPEIKLIKDAITGPERISWNGVEFIRGMLRGHEIVAVQTGVGKVLSAIVTQHLIDAFSPSAVIMSGVAGALNPGLEKGDILIGTDSIQHDMDATRFGFKRGQIPYTNYHIIPSDRMLLEIARSYKKENLKEGRILTGDQFFTGRLDPRFSYLSEELEGDAVEMEGAAAGLTAMVNGVPFLLIRVISDMADGSEKGHYLEFIKSASSRSFDLIEHILLNLG